MREIYSRMLSNLLNYRHVWFNYVMHQLDLEEQSEGSVVDNMVKKE